MGTHESAADPELAMPERPAEAVELCELLYRRIFGQGLIVVAIMAAYATVLSLLRADQNRTHAVVVSVVLLVITLISLALRPRLYPLMRRHQCGIALPALLVGGAAWAMGQPNDQMFYVITLALGVTGLTVRFSYVLAAAVVAGLGCAAPALLSDDPHVTTTAIAVLTVPTIFWLIIEQLARYVLRAYGETGEPPTENAGRRDSPTRHPTGEPHRKLRGRRLRLLLPGRAGQPEPEVQLSARQLEVLLLCAEGLRSEQIGECLNIGKQQVRKHLREARARTGSATTAALIAWALRHDLVPRPEHHTTN